MRTTNLKTVLFILSFCFSGSFLFSQNECVNGVSLYQKTFGGTKDDFTYHSAPTADSGYVLAGQTNSSGSGGYDGLVIKVNKKGNVVWSKTIGGSGNDIFNQIRSTSDNGFILCGTTRSYGSFAEEAWLVKIDASGNVQWAKKYGDGTTDGHLGLDVTQLSDGGYAFCGVYRWLGGGGGVAQSLIVRTDALGNVLWSKQYSVGAASDDAAGILEDGNSLVVVGYYNGSSFMDSYIMKLNTATGVMEWLKRYDADGRSTWFSKVAKTNSGYQVHSIITDNFGSQNLQVCIWNLHADGSFQIARKIVIPGIWTIGAGWHAFANGGFLVASGENNNSSDVTISNVTATGSIAWSKKFQRPGRQQVYSIESTAAGGYLAVGDNNNFGTLVNNTDAYVLRIDSAGGAGTCSGIVTNEITITGPFINLSSSSSLIASANVTFVNPVITVNSVAFAAAATTLCSDCLSSPADVPVVVATANPICAGSGTILDIQSGSLNGATSWKWYTDSCGGTLVGSGFAIAVSPAATTTYYVRGEGSSAGPGNCGSITITVNNQTSPTFTIIPPLCQNSIAPVLQTTSNNGVTGSWSPAMINTATPGFAYYTFTPDSNQCAASFIWSIAIIPPTTPAFTQIGPLCKNSFAPTLPTISNNNVTGFWSPATINTSIADSITYTFTPDSGQCAEPVIMNIVVNTKTTPVFTQIGPLCQNSIAPVLPTVSNNGVNGNWSPSTIQTIVTGVSTYTFTPDSGQCAEVITMDIVIVDKINVTIPDAKALNYSGIAYNTVYPAYGPASSITLTVQASGGSGSYIYSWSNGETTPSITVSPTSTTVYTVTVTDDKGCQVTASKEIIVQNINCNYHKVYMCHVTGNPDHLVDICIDDDAVPAHLADGCSLGECPGSRTISSVIEKEVVEIKVQVVPNPSQSQFKLILKLSNNAPVSLKVIDVLGRVIETRANITETSNLIFGNNLTPGPYLAEIIQGANRKVIKLIKM